MNWFWSQGSETTTPTKDDIVDLVAAAALERERVGDF